jgi:hypothetical protein
MQQYVNVLSARPHLLVPIHPLHLHTIHQRHTVAPSSQLPWHYSQLVEDQDPLCVKQFVPCPFQCALLVTQVHVYLDDEGGD